LLQHVLDCRGQAAMNARAVYVSWAAHTYTRTCHKTCSLNQKHSLVILCAKTMRLIGLFVLACLVYLCTVQRIATVTAADLKYSYDGTVASVSSFEDFEKHFGRMYDTVEERAYRKTVFDENQRWANQLNAANRVSGSPVGAVYGATKFSDWTRSEYSSKMLTYRVGILGPVTDVEVVPIQSPNDLPDQFDWRDHDAVSPVKDQGNCGR